MRVVELASSVLVAATGALLAEWGADVVAIESPEPRGEFGAAQPALRSPQLQRGKRSVRLDVRAAAGAAVLHELIARADVFVTDLTTGESDLQLDVDSLRRLNPDLIYARGSGRGPRGEETGRPATDYTSYWARGGLATTFQLIDRSLVDPASEPTANFGELPTAAMLAGGIAAAVFGRAMGAGPSVVDAALLGFAVYNLSMDVSSVAAGTGTSTGTALLPADRLAVLNPLTNFYRTQDGRFLNLCVLQERHFPKVCDRLGRSDLITDERFVTAADRTKNAGEFVKILDEIFATRTLTEWKELLAAEEWVWEPVQTIPELAVDPQVAANDYVTAFEDATAARVAGPVQFDVQPPALLRAPARGEHTEVVLREVGLDQDALDDLRRAGSIL